MKYKIKIVPVCINYERVFDSKYFQDDVYTGSFKPGTTLIDLMHKVFSMRKGKLGKVFVNYADAIDL